MGLHWERRRVRITHPQPRRSSTTAIDGLLRMTPDVREPLCSSTSTTSCSYRGLRWAARGVATSSVPAWTESVGSAHRPSSAR